MSQTGLALGKLFNIVGKASGVHISLTDAEAVTFVINGAAGAVNSALVESKGDGVEEQALATVTRVHRGPSAGGAWVEDFQDPAVDTYAATDVANDTAVVTVRGRELSDGFTHVELTDAAADSVTALVHDLNYVADPTSLLSPV